MLTRIPKDVPRFLALAAGLGLGAFGFTNLFMTARPSSTSGLAFIFIPIYSVVAALLGFLLGIGVRAALKRALPEPQDTGRHWWILPVLLVPIVTTASISGGQLAIETERDAQPSVLVDAGKLDRALLPNADPMIRKGTRVYSFDQTPEVFAWGSNSSDLVVEGNKIEVRDRATSRGVVVSSTALDYVNYVDVTPVSLAQHAKPGLAVVIVGRATGRRAIVLVLTSNYEVLLEERINRFWDFDSESVEIRANQGVQGELIVIGPDCERSLVIRSRAAV